MAIVESTAPLTVCSSAGRAVQRKEQCKNSSCELRIANSGGELVGATAARRTQTELNPLLAERKLKRCIIYTELPAQSFPFAPRRRRRQSEREPARNEKNINLYIKSKSTNLISLLLTAPSTQRRSHRRTRLPYLVHMNL